MTRIVFSNYRFIEDCARDGGSPLEIYDGIEADLTTAQIDGFLRAAMAFFEGYLRENRGDLSVRSVAVLSLLDSFEHLFIGIGTLDGRADFHDLTSFKGLQVTAEFVRRSLDLIASLGERPVGLGGGAKGRAWVPDRDVIDGLVRLSLKAILAAAGVRTPPWTAWTVQHNTVWSRIFGFASNPAHAAFSFRLRRALYNEIKEMDIYPNFRGARAVAFCLNVLGLEPIQSRRGHDKEFRPLQFVVLQWTRRNFGRLLDEHPKVADACLSGSISYQSQGRRLVKTYMGDLGKAPTQHYLAID